MSTETDDKAQSKFPRTSLRARNKTLMITPADVADYHVRSDERPERAVDLEDVFEDSLSSIADAFGANGEVVDPETSVAHDDTEKSSQSEESSEQDVLSDIWDSDEESEANEENHSNHIASDDTEEMHAEQADEDLFAAPEGVSNGADELFGAPITPKEPDPIIRETRSLQSAATIAPSLNVPSPSYSDVSSRVYGGDGSSALKSAAQEFREVHQEMSSFGAKEYVDWKKRSKLVGFLVSYAADSMGSYIELREGRLLVTSGQTSTDSCLVIEHETVSPMHAIMRISADGSILILDQLSEHGTKIRRGETGKEESLMGDKSTIFHGDVVIFGDCEYHVVIMGAAALKREA